METTHVLDTDYLDIVFAGKNKMYGGYILRKNYNRRALIAIGLVLLSVAVVIAVFHLQRDSQKQQYVIYDNGGVVLTRVEIPTVDVPEPLPPVENVAKPAGTPPVAATVKLTEPIVVDNKNVKPDDTPPELKSLENKMIGPVNHAGTPDGLAVALSANQPSGGGKGLEKAGNGTSIPIPREETITKAPDVMPEFPGGKEALLRFLHDNINYPVRAAEAGIWGQVVLSFVVNEKGKIEGIKVIKAIGAGCEQEAIRVVNSMPAWKPGVKNGKAVKVYYMLPVTYHLR